MARRLGPRARERIRELYDRGLSVWRISRVLGCGWQTVRRAVDPEYDERVRERERRRWRRLDDWEADLDLALIHTLTIRPGATYKKLTAMLVRDRTDGKRWERVAKEVLRRLASLQRAGAVYSVGCHPRKWFPSPRLIVRRGASV